MTRMAEHWAETERDLEECEFDHWQELLAADPAYEIWLQLMEAENGTRRPDPDDRSRQDQ